MFHFFEKVSKGQLKMVNVNIKNRWILLYCHFDKILKEPGTSFQFPALSQNYVKRCFSYNMLVFDQNSF